MTTDLATGLMDAEAAVRLRTDGYNELPSTERRNFLRIVVDVLSEPMFALLLGAGVIYLFLGDLAEGLVLFVFATASVAIAVVQEQRGERVLESLRDLTSPRALVVRNGERKRIPGREVVRGDVLVLVEGDRVPADARLITSDDLMADESLLTGESVPLHKTSAAAEDSVFAGTMIVRGGGQGVVVATGHRSEIGKIGRALSQIELEPPRLRSQTRRVVRYFGLAGLAVSIAVTALYGLLYQTWLPAILAGIAVGMAMLPEEFPLVLTVFMVMGARRLARARVLTRRAAAIETLGSATVLCTDKTGTLTENRMSVAALRTGTGGWNSKEGAPPRAFAGVIGAAALASAAHPFDPMEKALHDLASKHAATRGVADSQLSLIRSYGLRPGLLAMTNVWRDDVTATSTAYAKGAPETVVGLCRLDAPQAEELHEISTAMAQSGLRVLGIASAPVLTERLPDSQRDFDFEFLGFVGLADPLRDTVPAAVRECRSAGIRVIMITGDHPQTARAIALQAGLGEGEVISGSDIERLPDQDLALRIRTTEVFARISATQKLRIVEALKANGEIVAMTGDGVNDAPALKAAHIGIAMGGRGTDVAREASSIVLLDDDFASIVRTIRMGRRIYDNLRKAMGYILAVHVPIAGLAILPLLSGLPLVLFPIHIAFLEMVIDPACSIVFEAEAEERDVMKRPPRPPNAMLLSRRLVIWGLWQGVAALAAVGAVVAIAILRELPEGEMRALAFLSLVLANLGLIFVNRAFSRNVVAALRSNRALWIMVASVGAVMTVVFGWEPARALFRLGVLHWTDVGLCFAVCGAAIVVLEILKPRWLGTYGRTVSR